MKVFREHIIFRLAWLVMAMHVFNFSIDTTAVRFGDLAKETCYNKMENIVEVLLENLFQIENAIADFEKKENSEASELSFEKEIEFFQNNKNFNKNFSLKPSQVSYFNTHNKKHYPLHPIEIIPPPPKV